MVIPNFWVTFEGKLTLWTTLLLQYLLIPELAWVAISQKYHVQLNFFVFINNWLTWKLPFAKNTQLWESQLKMTSLKIVKLWSSRLEHYSFCLVMLKVLKGSHPAFSIFCGSILCRNWFIQIRENWIRAILQGPRNSAA